MSFLRRAPRQLAPGTLLMVALIPIDCSDSWIRTAVGSFTVVKPWSNDSVVSKPFARPASARSALALAMSVLYGVGWGHAAVGGLTEPVP